MKFFAFFSFSDFDCFRQVHIVQKCFREMLIRRTPIVSRSLEIKLTYQEYSIKI